MAYELDTVARGLVPGLLDEVHGTHYSGTCMRSTTRATFFTQCLHLKRSYRKLDVTADDKTASVKQHYRSWS